MMLSLSLAGISQQDHQQHLQIGLGVVREVMNGTRLYVGVRVEAGFR